MYALSWGKGNYLENVRLKFLNKKIKMSPVIQPSIQHIFYFSFLPLPSFSFMLCVIPSS